DKTEDERLLEKIGEQKVTVAEVEGGQKDALNDLLSRQNVVKVEAEKTITIKPTKQGLNLAKEVEVDERIGQLTVKTLKEGAWRKRGFRPYQVDVYQKPAYPAKLHPLTRQIKQVREIFCNMGFTEIQGPYVESAFWNFDALFQPQDHPARDMHDTFYLKTPKKTEIPGFGEYADKIRETHEDGGDTQSTGWGGRWDPLLSQKTLLRTHTTAVTARYLSTLTQEDMPAKVFCVGRVFRNEAIDYKHLPEFHQVEGIVVDPNVNFRNLLGILKEFYDQMGFPKIRFRPGYFPYTEMSVEPEVYFEEKGEWIELGGAGIFRPEVVKPLLGADVPVLAWGLGLDRVITLKLGLKDIRGLYQSDVNWLMRN
ncbi:MAG: phenylalanine--tRNA ligase subunit alpha, partial [Candidatus Altiarchaeales archaeon]|nr:phenylalanine--tRNA ligase subunit alpha [Candidatus Altiarchaeales archaeon]